MCTSNRTAIALGEFSICLKFRGDGYGYALLTRQSGRAPLFLVSVNRYGLAQNVVQPAWEHNLPDLLLENVSVVPCMLEEGIL